MLEDDAAHDGGGGICGLGFVSFYFFPEGAFVEVALDAV